jgi:hypothetical protein
METDLIMATTRNGAFSVGRGSRSYRFTCRDGTFYEPKISASTNTPPKPEGCLRATRRDGSAFNFYVKGGTVPADLG